MFNIGLYVRQNQNYTVTEYKNETGRSVCLQKCYISILSTEQAKYFIFILIKGIT